MNMQIFKTLCLTAFIALPLFASADPGNGNQNGNGNGGNGNHYGWGNGNGGNGNGWGNGNGNNGNGNGWGNGNGNGGNNVPLDGGIGLLAAAGIGYGVKKYAAHKKNK